MAPPPDDASRSSAAGKAPASASGYNGPPGHVMRRAKTSGDAVRPAAPRHDADTPGLPRRNSSLSEYSIEARNILNPRAENHVAEPPPESSPLASLSLAFALLPAIAGAVFENGHGFTTDIMLLGLAGVFLHWSVTQPWLWYHAAQQVRVQHEADADVTVDEDSEAESPVPGAAAAAAAGATGSPLEQVPEADDEAEKGRAVQRQTRPLAAHQTAAALRELNHHEAAALAACFASPLLSASLLHAIRAQLSRPSEGLVSNYNLTIFVLVSQLRVFAHLFRLVHARTLHLQRIVHANPHAAATDPAAELAARIVRLERLVDTALAPEVANGRAADDDAIARDVRNALSPDLDALNRAVRRYEKKSTLLQLQTESRFASLDARIDDAIVLAAAAVKTSSAPAKSRLLRCVDALVASALLPFKAALALLSLPAKWLVQLARRGPHTSSSKSPAPSSSSSASARSMRSMARSGKAPVQPRDRTANRAAKR